MMEKFRGHTLTKIQAALLQHVIDTMKDLHEIDAENDGYSADTVDSLIQYTEEFLYELGAIDKKVFSEEAAE
ncbi:hypothetical protein MHH84_07685 [Bacillus sp. FSL K6-1109]|jgi:hypothetical protein|nr:MULTISPECIES: hypothetical protein [Bacillus]EQM28658.1 hypothetical protein N399_07785 [Bacillus licheniformis CG-B52]KYC76945.1 hypothetical protein B4090_0174 [Bacillus licheniformis]MDE1436925.1 hypothetical protein [Bacillus licheniformis]MDE1447355.1 hypothetical protein [Bacillus licheniformis]MEC5250045.1 hypothetical protein [Bacillus licheniformis]